MQTSKSSYVVPILIAIVLVCVAAAIAYPLVNMHMKNLPYAAVTLDTGAQVGDTRASLGEIFAEEITSSEATENGESLIRWNTLTTKESYDGAQEQSKYYGMVVFPENYTELAIAQAYADDDIEGLKKLVSSSGVAQEKIDAAINVIDETARIYNREKRAKRLEIFKAECAKASHDEGSVNTAAGTANVDLTHATDENFIAVALALGMQFDPKVLDVSNASVVEDVLDQLKIDDDAKDAEEDESKSADEKTKSNDKSREGSTQLEEPVYAEPIKITYDYGKSPFVSGFMKKSLEDRVAKAGLKADVTYKNIGSMDAKSIPSPFAALATSQVLVLLLVIGAFACGILMARAFAVHRAPKFSKRFGRCVVMFFYSLVLSALVSGGVYLVAHFICGVDSASLIDWLGFMWIAAFAMCVFASGLATMSVGLSVFVCVVIAALGAFSGSIPQEIMPDMWAQWICPILPQMPIGEGVRQVLYHGGSFLQISNLFIPAIYAGVGAVIGLIMMLIPAKKVADEITITDEDLRWEAGEGQTQTA